MGVGETLHQKWQKQDRPTFRKMGDSPSSAHPPGGSQNTRANQTPPPPPPSRRLETLLVGTESPLRKGADIWRTSTQLPFSQLSPLPLKCTPPAWELRPRRDHQSLLGQ